MPMVCVGGCKGDRTRDRAVMSRMLYRLSYTSISSLLRRSLVVNPWALTINPNHPIEGFVKLSRNAHNLKGVPNSLIFYC